MPSLAAWNTISTQGVNSNYSRKITPICCHAYKVNRLWEEDEPWYVDRLTIEPQTFCGLKAIELKIQWQQCITITQSRLANKQRLLATLSYQTNHSGECLEIGVQMDYSS